MAPARTSAKRQHVVDTAYALFKRDGFHATGIDRIIAEADIAKMTMYRNFPSKDELIVAVLDHRARRFERQLDRLATAAATPGQKIATILDWHERWFRSADFHGCLFAHALAEFGDPAHPVFKAVARQKNGLRSRMQAILEQTMPPERAEGAAAALLMLIEGATLLAQMGEADAAIGNARKAAAAIIAGAWGRQ
ncbi:MULTISPECIES: TetR/AcrR family transcriptional regulator [Mesorhizobium]|uniref:TetR/AcrR family transcriptional regulator n=3 Tax=Phyllobacteriaceae TaxID=69277 RepID=UPI000FCA3B29|nr:MULTISPECIES: TetR/AcrR family transcriptional regulator [Mesorhizobium]MDX8433793.1 TetR/AcrR family transcriptional regulator [Mesorhizobium abyssinicae]RUW25885.1 TetR/AcrR family transcriptional regulator [Mesorhizobium sp. M4B.F.Ca.ET.013.02.1.1]RUW76665.1 TetR/AcrR family transcriptional regulator [Mesorhizobium sp. M4B.F.Ca.ET.049.02.1.2]RVD28897.1 TetR/AcrR family transcriptional regulator [Mesorhizobium sp. M4B.F.Ca.ET.017.02.2.1]RVD41055.1 TetR/AcrR family transcriptional regulato